MVQADKKAPEIKSYTERITDFSGGLNKLINGSLLNANEAQTANDVSFEQKGTLLPRRGRVKRYSAAFSTSPCSGIGEYYKKDGTSRIITAAGTKLYSDTPHLLYDWNTKANWEQTGITELGFDVTTEVEGSLCMAAQLLDPDIACCKDYTLWSKSTDVTLSNVSVITTELDLGLQITLNALTTAGRASAPITFNGTDYVVVCGKVYNPSVANGVTIAAFSVTNTVVKESSVIPAVYMSGWVTAQIKLTPAEAASVTHVGVRLNGTAANQYCYLYPFYTKYISAADYNNASYVAPLYSTLEVEKTYLFYGETSLSSRPGYAAFSASGIVHHNTAVYAPTGGWLSLANTLSIYTDVKDTQAEFNNCTLVDTEYVASPTAGVQLIAGSLSGTLTTGSISSGHVHSYPTISHTNTTVAGTTITLEARFSNDSVTWTAWTAYTSGVEITERYSNIQYRLTITRPDVGTTSPVITSTTLTYPEEHSSSGYWESNVHTLYEKDIATSVFFISGYLSSLPPGHSITAYVKYKKYTESTWSAWTAIADGEALPDNDIEQLQFKVEFTITGDITSSTLMLISKMGLILTPGDKKSYWQSQAADVSLASDLSSGVISSVVDLHSTGQVTIYTRSSANGTSSWSDWYAILGDGTVQHPDNNFVQILVKLINAAEVEQLTLVMSQTASVTEIKSGMTDNAEYSFATFTDVCVIANGVDSPLQWDATTAPTTLGITPPILNMLAVHNNRLWGVDATNLSRVRFSGILDPTTWGAYDFIDFNPDDGDKITAIIRSGQNLVIFKNRSVALLTGNASTNYSVTWLDIPFGAAGKNAVCVASSYVAYVSNDGIRFTDFTESILASERLAPLWEDSINKKRLTQASLFYWNNRLFVSLPSVNSLYNDTVWVYNFIYNSWEINTAWSISHWSTFTQYGERMLLGGSSTEGQLFRMDYSDTDDGVDIVYSWKSKDFNFQCPEKYKLFRNLFVDIEGISETSTMYVDLYVDGVLEGTYTTSIAAGDGVKYSRRVLPPLYDAVLGSSFAVGVRGRCGVHSISIEYVVRGNIPGGEL